MDEAKLRANVSLLSSVSEETGCKILLAQKAFSNYDLYPLLSEGLAGTEASGLYEARLGHEKMPGKEVHVFCGAYTDDEFDEVLRYADHIVFNSVDQLSKFGRKAKEKNKSVGLRINPECSTQGSHAIYDPCAPGSRLGVTRDVLDKEMTPELFSLTDGLHFHTLCEQDADDLEKTLQAVTGRFGDILKKVKWLNMGGGHHITRPGYDIKLLIRLIKKIRDEYSLDVYLEPGEAVALNAGYLVTRILDIVENNGIKTALLDASAACHMPDVLEMPYTPPLLEGDAGDDGPFTYVLAGRTCLAGDVIGKYSFDRPLHEGDILIFGDMAIYTTCKNNTFNGMPLPSILRLDPEGMIHTVKEFSYEDFKERLGS